MIYYRPPLYNQLTRVSVLRSEMLWWIWIMYWPSVFPFFAILEWYVSSWCEEMRYFHHHIHTDLSHQTSTIKKGIFNWIFLEIFMWHLNFDKKHYHQHWIDLKWSRWSSQTLIAIDYLNECKNMARIIQNTRSMWICMCIWGKERPCLLVVHYMIIIQIRSNGNYLTWTKRLTTVVARQLKLPRIITGSVLCSSKKKHIHENDMRMKDDMQNAANLTTCRNGIETFCSPARPLQNIQTYPCESHK